MTVSLAASDPGGQEKKEGLERIDSGSECEFTVQRMVCVNHILGVLIDSDCVVLRLLQLRPCSHDGL